MPETEEPVLESAPIAWRLAPKLCRKDAVSGEDCSWLHGFWQCLRIMELAATPDRHAEFYRRAFDDVAGASGPPRVLVSGAADYSMLAHVLAAFRGRGIEPAITVIDVCETPLYLNRWYARRTACEIKTLRCSVLEMPDSAVFDAVCTHSFLGQFSREQRPILVAAWRRLLRPGAPVITALPLRPWGADEQNRFTPDQAEAFRSVVRSRCVTLLESLETDQAGIMQKAESYLRARYGYPVRSGEEIRDLFERAGFTVKHLACGPVADERPSGAGGPGLRYENVHYASLIASRA